MRGLLRDPCFPRFPIPTIPACLGSSGQAGCFSAVRTFLSGIAALSSVMGRRCTDGKRFRFESIPGCSRVRRCAYRHHRSGSRRAGTEAVQPVLSVGFRSHHLSACSLPGQFLRIFSGCASCPGSVCFRSGMGASARRKFLPRIFFPGVPKGRKSIIIRYSPEVSCGRHRVQRVSGALLRCCG